MSKVKAIFGLLIPIVIVLQSLAFAASAQPSHQIDGEHLQSQHSHQQDSQLLRGKVKVSHPVATADEEQHDISDCHHCGHCSGSHLSWLSTQPPGLALIFFANALASGPKLDLIEIVSPTYRPPIA